MDANKDISPRSRTVALVLAIALFCCSFGGLHRLYTGKIFSFFLQFITLGGLGIWQIIDIVRILLGSFEDAQGRELKDW